MPLQVRAKPLDRRKLELLTLKPLVLLDKQKLTATPYKAWLTTELCRCIWAELVGNNHLIVPFMLAELVAGALLAVVSALMLELGVM
jgi:hypothetical protein